MPLFNFHTDDILSAAEFVKNRKLGEISDITVFDDLSFFTIQDPDDNIIMIGTG
ncbi:hypothetical protein D479_16524 [Halobacillus sp. BAB-2008]|nr:hypothetical protein D479_16524 [Halobacillus sp. BAB-2008]